MIVASKDLMTFAWQNKFFTIGATMMPCAGFGVDLILTSWDKIPQFQMPHPTNPKEIIMGPDMKDKTHKWVFKPNAALRLWNILFYIRRS
jgi:hypothetical protein